MYTSHRAAITRLAFPPSRAAAISGGPRRPITFPPLHRLNQATPSSTRLASVIPNFTPNNLKMKVDTTGCDSGTSGPHFKGAKLKTPIPDYLQRIVDELQADNSGETAQYIPELANANSDHMAVCLSTIDGFVYAAGDADVEFSIQSISKAFVYALALEQHGIEGILEHVGVEPSGEAFNELSLETETQRPLNPMINAGAITTHTLVGPRGITKEARFEHIRAGLSAFAGRELGVDEAVFDSELKTAYRNRAIGNMLRNYEVVDVEPDDIVWGYTRQCSIEVTARDLAIMGATLANGGIQPVTGERVLSRNVVRQVLSVMMTCGMYNGAGSWVTTVGFPAKSGVAGGIVGMLPGQVGIATFSPKLDKQGNSVRGVRVCKRLSDDMGLHIMEASEPARSVVRRDYMLRSPEGEIVTVLSLQGAIRWAPAERVLRLMSARSAHMDDDSVHISGFVLDLRRVHSIDTVSRKLLREAIRRLRANDMRVTIVGPKGILKMLPKNAPDCAVEDMADEITENLDQFDHWKRIAVPDKADIVKAWGDDWHKYQESHEQKARKVYESEGEGVTVQKGEGLIA